MNALTTQDVVEYAGIGVGAAIVLFLLVLLVWWVTKWLKKRRILEDEKNNNELIKATTPNLKRVLKYLKNNEPNSPLIPKIEEILKNKLPPSSSEPTSFNAIPRLFDEVAQRTLKNSYIPPPEPPGTTDI